MTKTKNTVPTPLSPLTRQLLQQLESEGRLSFAALGERLGMSKTPCWNKVSELQKNGTIEGYGARINPEKMGLNIRALVHVVVDFSHYKAFELAVTEHANVRSCHAVTGEYDYVLEILECDIHGFDQLLREELSQLPGVERFNTAISTRVVKAAGPYSLMLQ